MQGTANSYISMISTIANLTGNTIPIQFTTSNFYRGKQITRTVSGVTTTRSFSDWIIDAIPSTGGIVIMNYRDNVPYTKVVSSNGTLKTQSYSNQVLGTTASHYVTDDIIYATNQGRDVTVMLNTKCKTAVDFAVTEANCSSVLALDATAFANYGGACNSYWDYKASSFCEEGSAALLSVGDLLQQTYGTDASTSGYQGWGIFSYGYFKVLQ